MIVEYKKERINIPVKKVSSFGKILGLMFKAKNTENLLFEFRKKTKMSIHSFFVFFPFLAIWLDDENKVINFKIIKPFTLKVKPKKPFSKLVEVPFNNKNKKILGFFVGKSSTRFPPPSVKRKI